MLERLGMDRDVLDRARRSRDARFDGKFFIAVTSTGIYCRTICPAKLSKDAHVRYFATAAEAAAAGFRPCLRCRPESAPGSPAWLGTSAVVRRALRLIQSGALDQASVEQLAGRLGVGARHLSRLFRRHLGTSPMAVARTRRLHFAKQLLDETGLPITQIALASGFGSVRRFNDAFKDSYRRTPRDLRKTRPRGVSAGISLRLTYRPPYDWRWVSEWLARRAIRGLESVEAGVYRRLVQSGGEVGTIEVRPIAAADALELRILGAAPSELLALASNARRMFDLAADPARIREVLARDAQLAPLVTRRPGLRIPGHWDLFESAVRALVSRAVPPGEARVLLAQLVATSGEPGAAPAAAPACFPGPGALAGADPVRLGCAASLAARLQAFAAEVARRCGRGAPLDAAIRAAFPAPDKAWLSEYVALFGQGDPDALPCDAHVLSASVAAPAAAQLPARSESWRPFRGYAALHLLAAGNVLP
jgi:AraC family transcriptional regulator of adaptative response / DNA-3-methyladenine glycosylase II